MTFYEAALSVLTAAGHPIHIEELTRLVLEAGLLSHVGKTPQEVMEDRLLSMARKPKDRKIGVTAPHTFCLTSWGLPEDPEALDLPVIDTYEHNTGPLLRGRERDPDASPSKVRFAGRGERTRGQWREENVEKRQHMELVKHVAEAVLEILKDVRRPLSPVDLAASARDRDLVSDDLGADALAAAVKEDNRRRTDGGKAPLFDVLSTGEIALHGTVAAEPAKTERTPAAPALVLTPQKFMAAVHEHKVAVGRALLRRLGELEGLGFDQAMQTLLERRGFTDLKIARRYRDGTVFIGRKRMGLVELRYAVRVVRGLSEVTAADVAEHSRTLAQYGSQMGIILSASPVRPHVIQAAASAVPPIFLFCGDALARLCMESAVGVSKSTVEVFELDEGFFQGAGDTSQEDRERRRLVQQTQYQAQVAAQVPTDAQTQGPAQSEKSADALSEKTAVPDAPAGEGAEQPQAGTGLSRRQAKKERYRQKKEAREAARRMAAAAKAKARAEAAGRRNEAEAEAGTPPAPAQGESAGESPRPSDELAVKAAEAASGAAAIPTESSAALPETEAHSAAAEAPDLAASDVTQTHVGAEKAESAERAPEKVQSAEAAPGTSESEPPARKSASASVYDPGRFGNFSADAVRTLQAPHVAAADGAEAEAGAQAAAENAQPQAAEGAEAAADAAKESDKPETVRGRNKARHSRRRQAEKAAEMKAAAEKAEKASSRKKAPRKSEKKPEQDVAAPVESVPGDAGEAEAAAKSVTPQAALPASATAGDRTAKKSAARSSAKSAKAANGAESAQGDAAEAADKAESSEHRGDGQAVES